MTSDVCGVCQFHGTAGGACPRCGSLPFVERTFSPKAQIPRGKAPLWLRPIAVLPVVVLLGVASYAAAQQQSADRVAAGGAEILPGGPAARLQRVGR